MQQWFTGKQKKGGLCLSLHGELWNYSLSFKHWWHSRFGVCWPLMFTIHGSAFVDYFHCWIVALVIRLFPRWIGAKEDRRLLTKKREWYVSKKSRHSLYTYICTHQYTSVHMSEHLDTSVYMSAYQCTLTLLAIARHVTWRTTLLAIAWHVARRNRSYKVTCALNDFYKYKSLRVIDQPLQ